MNDFEVRDLYEQVQKMDEQLAGLHEAVDLILELMDMVVVDPEEDIVEEEPEATEEVVEEVAEEPAEEPTEEPEAEEDVEEDSEDGEE
tara:strand:- start:19 stop:282 length:264 start_codon:yes stop_codon:yes gene_type:complete